MGDKKFEQSEMTKFFLRALKHATDSSYNWGEYKDNSVLVQKIRDLIFTIEKDKLDVRLVSREG